MEIAIKPEQSVILLTDATRMLAEVKNIDDAKHLMDKAAAVKLYAKKHQLGREAVNYAHSIEIAAEIKLGEMLREMEKNKGARWQPSGLSGGNTTLPPDSPPPCLSDLGISKQLSAEARRLAALPEPLQEVVKAGIKSKKKAISENKQISRKAELIETAEIRGKYRVLLADPPWEYGNPQHRRDEQETVLNDHYPTMSIEALCQMPVSDSVDQDAVLFLWTTSPMLERAFAIIKSWGFQYKSSIIWDKVKHNVGYYVSVRHEFLLICTRGSCLPDVKKLHDSVVSIERSDKHSEKPAYFRELIDAMYPDGRRIELFARSASVDGWDVWGNQLGLDR